MQFDQCLVLDLGGDESRQVARKLRGEGVYCDVLPYDAALSRILKRAPKGLVLAGGSGDPFADQAKEIPEAVYGLALPILGLGYGAGLLLRNAGATRTRTTLALGTLAVTFEASPLFDGLTQDERVIERLDEFDAVDGYQPIATVSGGVPIAFANPERRLFALGFLPEQNDPDGLAVLRNFALSVCGCTPDWNIERFAEAEMDYIRQKVGARRVLMTVSGGVDSAVAALLMSRAIGEQLLCLYVDTGLMRDGEESMACRVLAELGLSVRTFDARTRFLKRLMGVYNPQAKKHVVLEELARVFEDYLDGLDSDTCLAQGTTYDDVLGDVPDALPVTDAPEHPMRLLPLRNLFKDEVRMLGESLGLPPTLTRQQPFPGAGLSLRCLGEVTEDKLRMLRVADRIFREEIEAAGLDRRMKQYFAVLTDLQTDDADGKSGFTLALRAVHWTNSARSAAVYRLPYDLIERVVERVTREASGINRVVYDVTGKPPAGIEWD